MKNVAELFLARAEWWSAVNTLQANEALGDIFWSHSVKLDNLAIDQGFPITVDPSNKLKWVEVQQIHVWIDLFMWKLSGGDL